MKQRYPIFVVMVGLLTSMIMSNANAQLTKNEALAQLTPSAIAKVKAGEIDLNALLENDSNDLIVEYAADQSSATAVAERALHYAALKKAVRNKLSVSGHQVLRDYKYIPYSADRVVDRASLVALLNDGAVKAVYPNQQHKKQLRESLPLIRQPAAARQGFLGEGTAVVVLDTGVDYTDRDFGYCTSPGVPRSCRVVVAFDVARNDYELDDDGHGTNVAGIVAGVAPGAKLIGLDVFTRELAYDSDVLAGLNWTLNNTQRYNIKAVNMSLGYGRYSSTCATAYTRVFSDLRAAGVAPVVSAGNDGYTNAVEIPACTAGAVAVGAVYDDYFNYIRWDNCTDYDIYPDDVACFSNSGNLVKLLAPGAWITAAGITYAGTSQAAPHVAGAIAVLRAPNAAPDDTVTQTVDLLVKTGKPVTDRKNNLTKPRIDLLAAVNRIAPPPSYYPYYY